LGGGVTDQTRKSPKPKFPDHGTKSLRKPDVLATSLPGSSDPKYVTVPRDSAPRRSVELLMTTPDVVGFNGRFNRLTSIDNSWDGRNATGWTASAD